MTEAAAVMTEARLSPWTPLRHPVFRALFIAQLASNIGTLMQSVGSAWLMGDLGASSFLIALVPTASMLPVLLVGIPGGALADIFDRRRLLIGGQLWMLVCAAALAIMSFAHVVTPFGLLALTFGLGTGSALSFPAFQAIQPDLVPQHEFRQAFALSSLTFNVGRAVGPAIGGFVVAVGGPGWVFLINAVSFLAIVGVLVWWRQSKPETSSPAETFSGAMRAGLRYAVHSPSLRGILNRTALFCLPAAALQALLPIVARNRLHLSSGGYGVLLGCFGIGAASAAAGTVESGAAAAGYHLIARYEIGGAESGYDYLHVDTASRRLFVTHGTKIEVLDVDSGARLGQLEGLRGVHGVGNRAVRGQQNHLQARPSDLQLL